MRKFKLKNANGNEFDLTSRSAFLTFPEGLGTEREHNYFSVGMSYRKLSTKYNQKLPYGELSFLGYAEFTEFAEFLRHEPLVLCYQPEDTWFYLDCDLAFLNKGEISQDTGRLDCPVEFSATGTWRKESVTLKCGDVSSSAGKVYPYTYPYTYSDNSIGSITYNNNSNLEQYGKVIVDGPSTNPGWVLFKDSKAVLSGKVNVTLADNERLIVNADPLHYEIGVYTKTNMFLRDVMDKSDFSTQRFVVLPQGESILNFTSESDVAVTAYLEVSERYELV